MMFVHQNVAHYEIGVFGGNLHRVGFFFLLCWFEGYCTVRVLRYVSLEMLLQRYTHCMYMTNPSCYPIASVRLGMGHCFVKLGKMDKAR